MVFCLDILCWLLLLLWWASSWRTGHLGLSRAGSRYTIASSRHHTSATSKTHTTISHYISKINIFKFYDVLKSINAQYNTSTKSIYIDSQILIKIFTYSKNSTTILIQGWISSNDRMFLRLGSRGRNCLLSPEYSGRPTNMWCTVRHKPPLAITRGTFSHQMSIGQTHVADLKSTQQRFSTSILWLDDTQGVTDI